MSISVEAVMYPGQPASADRKGDEVRTRKGGV